MKKYDIPGVRIDKIVPDVNGEMFNLAYFGKLSIEKNGDIYDCGSIDLANPVKRTYLKEKKTGFYKIFLHKKIYNTSNVDMEEFDKLPKKVAFYKQDLIGYHYCNPPTNTNDKYIVFKDNNVENFVLRNLIWSDKRISSDEIQQQRHQKQTQQQQTQLEQIAVNQLDQSILQKAEKLKQLMENRKRFSK